MARRNGYEKPVRFPAILDTGKSKTTGNAWYANGELRTDFDMTEVADEIGSEDFSNVLVTDLTGKQFPLVLPKRLPRNPTKMNSIAPAQRFWMSIREVDARGTDIGI